MFGFVEMFKARSALSARKEKGEPELEAS